jgi:hypothetical protein
MGRITSGFANCGCAIGKVRGSRSAPIVIVSLSAFARRHDIVHESHVRKDSRALRMRCSLTLEEGRRSKRRCEILNVTPDGGRLSTFGLMKLVIVASLRSLIARGQHAPPTIKAMHIDPSIISHSSHNCATRAEMSFSARPTVATRARSIYSRIATASKLCLPLILLSPMTRIQYTTLQTSSNQVQVPLVRKMKRYGKCAHFPRAPQSNQ